MILADINNQLDKLYTTDKLPNCISIGTWYRIDGDPINFHYYQEDEKYARIMTNDNFSNWMSCCPGGWTTAAPLIEQLASKYNVQWDNENGKLFIRFRRNEMTLAQAVMHLLQAVFLVGSIT